MKSWSPENVLAAAKEHPEAAQLVRRLYGSEHLQVDLPIGRKTKAMTINAGKRRMEKIREIGANLSALSVAEVSRIHRFADSVRRGILESGRGVRVYSALPSSEKVGTSPVAHIAFVDAVNGFPGEVGRYLALSRFARSRSKRPASVSYPNGPSGVRLVLGAVNESRGIWETISGKGKRFIPLDQIAVKLAEARKDRKLNFARMVFFLGHHLV